MALMTQTRQQTDTLMNAPDTSDPAELLRCKAELDALSVRYRGLSAATTPLAKLTTFFGLLTAGIAIALHSASLSAFSCCSS